LPDAQSFGNERYPPGNPLPFTGSPVEMLVKTALWLLVLGAACLAIARFRRRRTT
jgi:hypothetical protein